MRHPVEDILNLSPHPLDWTWEIVEDLPCNEIATTTNHQATKMNRTEALTELTAELRNLLQTAEALLPGADSDEDAKAALLGALTLLRRGSMKTLKQMEYIDIVTPG